MNSIRLATSSDDKYFVGLLVMVATILKWSAVPVILNFGYDPKRTSQSNLAALRNLCQQLRVSLKEFPLNLQALPSKRHISQSTFAKFFFLETLQESFAWIDSDAFAAQPVTDLALHLDQNAKNGLVVATRHDGTLDRFNAGVFIAHPPASIFSWESHLDDSRESLEQHIFQEQGKLAGSLPAEWNWTTYWSTRQNRVARATTPRIFHATGPIKPWHLNPRLWDMCIDADCDWAPWFLAYRSLAASLGNTWAGSKTVDLDAIRESSMRSIHIHRSTLVFRTVNRIPWSAFTFASTQLRKRFLSGRGDFHPLH